MHHNIISAQYAGPEPVGGYPDDALVVIDHAIHGQQECPANSSNEGGGLLAYLSGGGVIDPYVEPEGAAAARIDATKRAVVAFADELADKITGPVARAEQFSWGAKEELARAYKAGTATPEQIAKLSGELNYTIALDGDLDSLADKIITNADFYWECIKAITGVRRNTMAIIDGLGPSPTQEQLDTVVNAAKVQAEAEFTTLMQSA